MPIKVGGGMNLKVALESAVSRRSLLLGTLSLAAVSFLAACTGGVRSAVSSSASPSAATTATGSPSPVVVATPACVVTPAETEGPYFVDERLNRSDIVSDPSDGSRRPGIPLSLTFSVAQVGTGGCTALPNAQVDVWHCDALGVYSDVGAQGSVGKRYLRGYQVTDAVGAATFQTIYPGWYPGRAVHIHFKVRTFSGTSKTFEFASQVFFDDTFTDEVYRQAPYSSHPNRDTRNATDMVYSSNNNSGSMLLVAVAPRGAGYAASFAIGLKLA
ncbi:MAG TPA: intradiol ring-cleavage dioxygenase [Candidatus Dormibacteraeota bacterium]